MEPKETGTDTLSISVPNEMNTWLKTHKDINRSRLFQEAVDKVRYNKPIKKSSTFIMISILALVLGFSLIGFAVFTLTLTWFLGNNAITLFALLFCVGASLIGIVLIMHASHKRSKK